MFRHVLLLPHLLPLDSMLQVQPPQASHGNPFVRKLTVEENILAILETCDIEPNERMIRLGSLLEELDLSGLADSKAYQLSGGEKRRLEITRALVTNPSLLLLDEPFAGIDPIAVYEVQKIIRRLK